MQHISKWPTDKGKGWRLETETGEIIATLRGEDAKDHAAFLVKAANLYPEMVLAIKVGRDLVRTVLYQHPDDAIAQEQSKVIETILQKIEPHP